MVKLFSYKVIITFYEVLYNLLSCVANLVKILIVLDEFNVKAPCIAPVQDITEMDTESSILHFPIKSYMKQKRHVLGRLLRQH